MCASSKWSSTKRQWLFVITVTVAITDKIHRQLCIACYKQNDSKFSLCKSKSNQSALVRKLKVDISCSCRGPYWSRVHEPCWTVCTWQHLAMHLMTQEMVPCRDRLCIRVAVISQSAEPGAKIHITAVAPTAAQKVLQFFSLICQHLHRREVANTFWYDEAR